LVGLWLGRGARDLRGCTYSLIATIPADQIATNVMGRMSLGSMLP
jgi:hypothetical protein